MFNKVRYIISVYSTRLVEWMVKRAGKQKQNFVDKRITSVITKMMKTDHLENDYMADEWLESEPGFTIEELEAYENSESILKID